MQASHKISNKSYMKYIKNYFLIFTLLIHFNSLAQSDKFNLSFEEYENKNFNKWNVDKQLGLTADSIFKIEGKNSLKLTNNKFEGEKTIKLTNNIPFTYEGNNLKFQGYIKTEEVKNGNVYLYVIVEDETNQFYFDMTKTFDGTKEWEKFEINIPYTNESTRISINCNFNATGTIWLDNFNILIDNVNIKELTPKNNLEIYNSNFSLDKSTNKEELKKILIIGKLWGYLKYYHPNVCSGLYDWDRELLKILPIYKSKNFKIDLENWVSNLGEVEKYNNLNSNEKYFKQIANFDWFNNSLINNKLKNKLIVIKQAKRDSLKTHYAELENNIAEFKNEKLYPVINYSDDGIKILSIFRYWAYIDYFFPYKYLMTKNIDDIIYSELRNIKNINTELDYVLFLQKIICQTEDTHSSILFNNKLEEYFGVMKLPVNVKNINDKIIVNDILQNSSLFKLGDEIIEVDNELIINKKTILKNLLIGSNLSATNRNIANNSIRTNKNIINVKVKRDDNIINFQETTINKNLTTNYKIPKNKIQEISSEISYLFIKELNKNDIDSVFNRHKSKNGVILDFRGYPDDFSSVRAIFNYVFEKEFIADLLITPTINNSGNFKKINQTHKTFYTPIYNGNIVILIDENTQSASEYITMVLSYSENVTIIGSETSGTDGPAKIIKLPGNVSVNMTRLGLYTKDGKQTQKTGIIPDIKIKNTINSIKNNEDLVLVKAIEFLKSQ